MSGKKLCVSFVLFLFWKELWRFKVKESTHFVEKCINFNNNVTESKIENPAYSFRQASELCVSAHIRICKLKVKLWWVGACERKKRAFCVPFILFEGIIFSICVLSQCIAF